MRVEYGRVDAQEYARLHERYAPLTAAVRDLEHPRLLHEDTGRPVVFSNPVIGVRNPFAPPLTVRCDPDGRYRSEFILGAAYEGPPGLVHGGICALVLDQLLGEAATAGMTEAKFTGTITVRYLRGTPLGPCARGVISDGQGPTVEAEGTFIMPAWARDAK